MKKRNLERSNLEVSSIGLHDAASGIDIQGARYPESQLMRVGR